MCIKDNILNVSPSIFLFTRLASKNMVIVQLLIDFFSTNIFDLHGVQMFLS